MNPDPTMMPDPASLCEHVVQAVVQAGALLRAEFHRPGGPRGEHGHAAIDEQIEVRLRDQLLQLNPCDWHGEELACSFSGARDVWVVDPNDGTSAFLKGLRGSAISVALMRDETPVLGVVYAPMAPDDEGDLFAWAEGLPMTRNGVPVSPEAKPSDQPYRFDTVIALNEGAGNYADHNHRTFEPASVLAVPSIAYRLALAAAGDVDAGVGLVHGLAPYDVAGGQALLAAMGCDLLQLDGAPLRYGRHARYSGCVGGRAHVVREVIRRAPGGGARTERAPARPAVRTPLSNVLNRAHGVILGQLVGDALGSQVEFMTTERIRRLYPEGLRDLLPGGTWDTLAGQPTDDSEMALALARSLSREGGFVRDAVARAYIDWKASLPFDIGGTVSAGIAALAGRGAARHESQANGALMRVSPIGIHAAGRPALAADLARQDAALTHPHPVCLAASAAFAAAISVGVAGGNQQAMWSAAYANVGNDDGGVVRACLERSLIGGPPDFNRHRGWVLIALGNAFHRLYTGQTVEVALVETVLAGGDTDTNAAICGALVGAAWGGRSIPVRWWRQVLACRPVRGQGVRNPRPMEYWPDDALDLAEAVLVAGAAI